MRTLIAIVTVAFTFSLASCRSEDSNTSAPTAPTTTLSPGESVYRQSCARCHGVFLEGRSGKGAPPIDIVKLATLNDQNLRLTIVNGKGDMPGFSGLSNVEIDQLIGFLRSKA